ncbi:SCO2525 family SAM-dependent methyltransferase [Amycolatopsis taiwanensis]|uniref:SCO2525 family SAM-dependent methyltransferase n=1 Tax=Amycolatopsis taiwanensis TaxID=342230 RepID=UPI0004AF9FCF|nr:SCO2525 family SAM-dependent methyltransferase [Amycolatopsis taiwanensis]
MTSEDRRNGDYPWDSFDPEEYLRRNYAAVHEDDRRTLAFVRDFFVDAFADDPVRTGRRGIDVGTGANLYPALAMLPFCDRLTLYEHSRANVDWLIRQRYGGWPSWSEIWGKFWLVLRERRVYAELGGNPQLELAKCTDVTEGSVFALSETSQQWDIGTMFFVAESITPRYAEFVAAVEHFLGVLRPGAPFAIAFMAHSTGYQVADNHFPAIAISIDDVLRCLFRRADDVVVQHTVAGGNPLRDGYGGMIVACGRAAADLDRGRSGTPWSMRSRG